MQHVISCLVENRSGVLSRVANLFSARGYNIDSLCVGETDDPTVSRMTIVTRGDDKVLEQINKQLNKLIDVIKVQDFVDTEHVERELVLIKVSCDKKDRSEVMQIASIFRGKIVDVHTSTLTIEITGALGKVMAILDLLKPFKILELVRTGRVAIARGSVMAKLPKK
jgi:acetolactate synthase I/III small subunit